MLYYLEKKKMLLNILAYFLCFAKLKKDVLFGLAPSTSSVLEITIGFFCGPFVFIGGDIIGVVSDAEMWGEACVLRAQKKNFLFCVFSGCDVCCEL